jgi:hypothetical protein
LSLGYFGGTATVQVEDGGSASAAQILFGNRGALYTANGGTLTGNVILGLGGTLHNDGQVVGDITVSGGSHLSGSGIFDGIVTIGDGGVFSPGASPGYAATTETFWNPDGRFLWEINATAAAGGSEGNTVGWDLWNAGGLSIGGPFTIALATLTQENEEGPLLGWDPTLSQSWRIATTNNGAFASLGNLVLDTSAFLGPLAGGEFHLVASTDGRDLYVNFTAVPEASTLLFAGLGGIMIALCKRRKCWANRRSN